MIHPVALHLETRRLPRRGWEFFRVRAVRVLDSVKIGAAEFVRVTDGREERTVERGELLFVDSLCAPAEKSAVKKMAGAGAR